MSSSSGDANHDVTEELWRIFTFYAMHADPTSPELLKVANFMRFAKDCQLVHPKRLPSAALELELARVARNSRACRSGEGVQHYNTSFSLDFSDFMLSLNIIATKIYCHNSPEVAARRLLLENVLFLACRRIPHAFAHPLAKEPEAVDLITKVHGAGLKSIFAYYLSKASQRRNLEYAHEAERREKSRSPSETMRPRASDQYYVNPASPGTARALKAKLSSSAASAALSSPSSPHSSLAPSQQHKERMKDLKDLIGYQEYLLFCHDFGLKSSALLTAIQMSEIFYNVVPLDHALPGVMGMSFEKFCEALLHIASLAYRDVPAELTLSQEAPPSLPPCDKVNSLLLYMWKYINNANRAKEMANSRLVIAVSHAGSLNTCGAGLFSDTFAGLWQKAGYPDYGSVGKGEFSHTHTHTHTHKYIYKYMRTSLTYVHTNYIV